MRLRPRLHADPLTIYFHGLPGGPDEFGLFGAQIEAGTTDWQIPDRSLSQSLHGDERFALIAADLQKRFPKTPLRFVCFSLGAAAALRTAPYLGTQVESIDLISAAAPLQLGSYLPQMAGALIFKIAQRSSALFQLITRTQSIIASRTPGKLYDALFSSAHGNDRQLRNDPVFRETMLQILPQALGADRKIYTDEIRHYVQDWSDVLRRVEQPVSIHHGSDDNWSPVQMAHDLAAVLPKIEQFKIYEGASHYSCLEAYLRQVDPG